MKRIALAFALMATLLCPSGNLHAQAGTLNDTYTIKVATGKAFAASQKDTSGALVAATQSRPGNKIASATFIADVLTVSDSVSVERTVQYRPFGGTAWVTANKDTVTQANSSALVVSELAIRSATADLVGKITGYIRVVYFFLASGNENGGTYSHTIVYKP